VPLIRPFRALRYAADHVPDLAVLVAPPYDVVSPEERQRLIDRDPRNVIRIELPVEEQGDQPDDRYRRAARTLAEWRSTGVLHKDPRPAFYVYEQTYRVPGTSVERTCRGFFARLRLEPFGPGSGVLPHERTLTGPKEDRYKLLRATGVNISPVVGLYADPGGRSPSILAAAAAQAPSSDVVDDDGVRHRLWILPATESEDGPAAELAAAVQATTVTIADGHHRYETAVAYADRHPGRDDKLMAFFSMETPGVTIFPNHRLVHGVADFTLSRLLTAARRWFEVTPLDEPAAFRPSHRALAVVTADGAARLALRPDAFDTIPWPAGTSRAWRDLAVSILHEGVLKPFLGITDAKLDAKTHVEYTADQLEAIRLAREGRYQAAFLIAPTTLDELEAVVRGGEVLPQKSTHFYPKLLDGLVFHRLGE
jgi:uncharacterized protein (DUF1015 family)